MKKRRLIKIAAVLAFLVILGLLLPIPYTRKEALYCTQCRATCTRERWLWFNSEPRMTEDALAVYWRQNIEPGHTHQWRLFEFTELKGATHVYGSTSRDSRFTMPSSCELAILESFANPVERQAFARSFFDWDWHKAQGGEYAARNNAIDTLAEAYKQNPDRKDWQQILKRLGITK